MGLAEDHVDWWLSSVRQPLIDTFNHGYKHGREDSMNGPQSAKKGSPLYEQAKTHTQVPVRADMSSQEEIARAWGEKEKRLKEAGP